MSLPEIKEWHVETLRLTLFSAVPVNAAGREWWKIVTNAVPEATLNRQSAGEYSETGEFLGGQFELRVAFNRVDWVLSYPFSDMPGSPSPGDIATLTPKWLECIKNWLDNVDFPVNRIAAGSVLVKKVNGYSAGNKVVNDYLHFMNIDSPQDMADLALQVNIPSVFASVAGLRHNRIAKLAVLDRQMITIGPAGFPTTVVDTVVRNELDMSTAVDNIQPILADRLYPLTCEMVDAFLTILKKGMVDDKIQ